jgi:hypothetical protein
MVFRVLGEVSCLVEAETDTEAKSKVASAYRKLVVNLYEDLNVHTDVVVRVTGVYNSLHTTFKGHAVAKK